MCSERILAPIPTPVGGHYLCEFYATPDDDDPGQCENVAVFEDYLSVEFGSLVPFRYCAAHMPKGKADE